ncbi:MAG: glycosyl-4,4'-diaponeurosporenoate acyltransferase [Eubacteriales bacterium]|nr:glycosyl-4,4'-diaponeurosporenoate acyltransferase [Eubacteriales bacterium]
MPKKFHYLRFPYISFGFEKNGEIYNKIRIRKWQNKLPDMSRIFFSLMPAKKLPKQVNVQNMERMVQETCVAEFIHVVLCIMGLGCLLIWKGIGGWVLFVLYLLGNIPFILIQRYNRPKLVRLLKRLQIRETTVESKKQEITYEESSDIKLQYGARA